MQKKPIKICNICNQDIIVDKSNDPTKLIEHVEKYHPDHYVAGMRSGGRYYVRKKNYYNPISKEWYWELKHFGRSISRCGITNEEFYLKYGKEYLPVIWKRNENDPILGNARNHNKCIECGKLVDFNIKYWNYNAFCYNTKCNVNWYNRNTNRHKEAGKSIKNTMASGDINQTQIGFWIKQGFSEEEAKEKVKERQTTNTLEKFIQRHGEEEGKRRWIKRQERWLNSLENNGWFGNHSKVSLELFDAVSEKISDLRYGKNELNVKLGHKVKKPDCTKQGTKKVIEFFGDYFHANPDKYKSKDVIRRIDEGDDILAEDIWKKDKERLDLFKNHKFDVLVIWEKDYRDNPQGTIDKCIKFFED